MDELQLGTDIPMTGRFSAEADVGKRVRALAIRLRSM